MADEPAQKPNLPAIPTLAQYASALTTSSTGAGTAVPVQNLLDVLSTYYRGFVELGGIAHLPSAEQRTWDYREWSGDFEFKRHSAAQVIRRMDPVAADLILAIDVPDHTHQEEAAKKAAGIIEGVALATWADGPARGATTGSISIAVMGNFNQATTVQTIQEVITNLDNLIAESKADLPPEVVAELEQLRSMANDKKGFGEKFKAVSAKLVEHSKILIELARIYEQIRTLT